MIGLWLWSPLKPLWRPLKRLLQNQLTGASRVLVSNFEDLLTTTVNDLIGVIQSDFGATNIRLRWSDDRIVGARRKDVQISFRSFPVDWVSTASPFVLALRKVLAQNVALDAARNAAGVADPAWGNLLDSYSAEVVKFGAPFALKRMLDGNLSLDGNYYILAISENESYFENGRGVHVDLVKAYLPPTGANTQKALRTAKRVWRKRHGAKYRYEKGKL